MNNPLCMPKERGNRLRDARKLAKLTVKEMSDESLNYNTLGGWESGKHGGLTEKGAIKVCERLAREKVICTPEWLLTGEGVSPHLMTEDNNAPSITSLKDFLPEQIKYFQKLYPAFLGMIINDDAMDPTYRYGEYIAGLPMSIDQLRLATGKTIIAKLENGRTMCRTLLIDPITRTVSLVATNPKHPEALLNNVKIVEWALILCHFKNETL